ncbi:MAG: ABC transporter ATP-binding protein [Bacteroidales bacterium]|nr:MAG: ABC transporter ATP-binding protein [Bacteroidales bacterium]
MTEKTAIRFVNLTKVYKGSDDPALNNVSLTIPEYEIFGLLGPNGAGKTTTINILCGLLKPTLGKVVINGLPLEKNLHEIRRFIGVVPQEIALYPTLTANENLRFFGNMYGLKGRALKSRIAECLQLLGLEKNASRKIKTYSGGMKRRINLIAGILHKPEILFLDEPTVGIDVQSRNVIIDYLRELNASGTTIIYTSHYMEEAESFCSRIAIIDYGEIIAEGNPIELINSNSEDNSLEDIFIRLTGRRLRDN